MLGTAHGLRYHAIRSIAHAWTRATHSLRPAREFGAHNLSSRHARLGASMRYKAGFINAPTKKESVAVDKTLAKDPASVIGEAVRELAKPAQDDVGVPPPPEEPGPEECCMSGCAVCVRDLWAEALAQWKEKYGHLDTALKNVPRDVSGDAFAALEAQLAAKHAATQS